MTVYKKFTDDDPGRAAMKAVRLARSTRVATPPKLQGLLDDVIGDEPNKLPKAFQGTDNNVVIDQVLEITPPPQPNRPVKLELLWKGVPVGNPINTVTPIAPSQTLVLPASATITEGIFPLGYRLTYAGVPKDYDSPVSIYIDKEAPNKNVAGVAVELPTGYEDFRITKERLEANPVITLTIPLHSDRKTGDIADVYMGASEPGTYIGTYTAPDDTNSDMTVDLTKAQVENGREGQRIIYYKWRDRVGNEGPSSHALDVVVELTAAPGNLKPLEVPEAPGPDYLITIKDASPDVGVVIEAYDNIGPLDEVALIWDGIAQPRKRSADGLPMIFDVPYEHVKRNGLGPRAVTVTYSVWRGEQEYPETTMVPVNVDLRRPGTLPPDPENPEVGNPNLSQVTVQAKNTTDPNKFELIDAGEEGTASTVIDIVRSTGDVYQLYWGGVAVPAPGGQYTVLGTEVDGDPIEFKIPGDFITAQGNGLAIPVHYEITNPALPDENPNPSLRQPVSVYVVEVTLPAPKIKFTETFAGVEYLICKSLRNISNVGWAAVVEVQGGAPLKAGMDLEFIWEGTTYDESGMPVLLPDYPFPKKLIGNEHIDGFTVYLPHDGALLPIKDGSGKIRYEVTIDRLESSDEHEVQVVVRDGEGGNCPLP
ncbi:hypothetical protein [Pseudomonas brassicacearum]|uniref:Uncharacterized protein n=1 Tax=Pseudomonas brassicacearum TaxID=930166 RepID=A0A423JV50_9PSED|nr:hypothetical protein [Pseudomonas brassicacearum]RON41514.1 hypothetical protein BK664_02915 [Pseudomonas brassicacearum]